MIWRPLVLAASLLIQSIAWAGPCADLVTPVISGRGLGAQIRAMALAQSEDEEEQKNSVIAQKLIAITGTEIHRPEAFFFLDESDREAVLIYLDLIAKFAPEASEDRVDRLRRQLLNNNLYNSRFMHVTASQFSNLTQTGRRKLLEGASSRKWLTIKDIDPKQLPELQAPTRLRSFEAKADTLYSLELISAAEIHNLKGLIGYQIWYKALYENQPVIFDFYLNPNLKPMIQEIQPSGTP